MSRRSKDIIGRTGSGHPIYSIRHDPNGYIWLNCPTHPLAPNNREVSQHRANYYDDQGDGPFECYHCQKQVTWKVLHIDHLNDDKHDNSADNIVASCAACNLGRARERDARKYTYAGKTQSLRSWSVDTGISYRRLNKRLTRGWSVERTLTEPLKPTP